MLEFLLAATGTGIVPADLWSLSSDRDKWAMIMVAVITVGTVYVFTGRRFGRSCGRIF